MIANDAGAVRVVYDAQRRAKKFAAASRASALDKRPQLSQRSFSAAFVGRSVSICEPEPLLV
jgi:hypothetical protein